MTGRMKTLIEKKMPTKPCNCPDPMPGEFEETEICNKCWGLDPQVPAKKPAKKTTKKKKASKEVDVKVV